MDPFKQLEQEASTAGVRLVDAYAAAGIADSTYYRHRLGRFKPRWGVMIDVQTAIQELAHGIAGAD